jgi:hypothetical protein
MRGEIMNDVSQKILDDLAYVASKKRMVNLITNFRGIPINLTVSVIRCSSAKEKVRLYALHRQIVSLKKTGKILVQSDLFPNMVIADIDHIDLYTKVIILSNLCYAGGSMGQRKNVRVQPENPLHAEIETDHGYKLSGEIIDLSLDGLSVGVQHDALPDDDLLAPQTSVEINVALPVGDRGSLLDITIPAKIVYTKQGQQTCRVGLLTFLDEIDRGVLRRYIFDRQTEILEEIQRMNNGMLETI